MKIECLSLMLLYFSNVGGEISHFYRAMDRNAKRSNSTSGKILSTLDSFEQRIKESIEKEKIRIKMCESLKLKNMCSDVKETTIKAPEVASTQTDPEPASTEQPKTRTDNLSLVFSEPSEHSNDTNCMKFKLPDDSVTGLPLKGADLIVHITNRRRRSEKKKGRGKKRHSIRNRKISIKVSWLDPSTQRKKSISRLRFKPNMEKNKKWYKLKLPTSILKSAREESDNALNLCIECKRCNRKTQIILPLKTNKKRLKFMNTKRQKGKKKRKNGKTVKLRKNRPFLLCRIPERTSFRRRRDAVLCSSNSTCCRKQTYIRFSDIGLGNKVAYPDGFYSTECAGTCSHFTSQFNTETSPSSRQCAPTKYKHLQALIILDKSMTILDIPKGQVEQCSCHLN